MKGETMPEVKRERHVEIRWVGDDATERAFLDAVGLTDREATGKGLVLERWMQIPERKAAAAREALTKSGARVLTPAP